MDPLSRSDRPATFGSAAPIRRRHSPWLWVSLALILVLTGLLAALALRGAGQDASAPLATHTDHDLPVESTSAAPPQATPAPPTPPAVDAPPQPAAPTSPPAGSDTGDTAAATDDSAPSSQDGIASGPDLAPQLRAGFALIAEGKLVDGRALLSDLFFNNYADLDRRDVQAIRDTLSSVNKDLVFGPKLAADDALCELYVVQAGDMLSRVAPRFHVPYMAIELVNNVEARRIRIGQKLKVIRGPLHALVRKSEFILDLVAHEPSGKPVYVRSFPVGLGEEDSTPPGVWTVGAKVANPSWTNPRTNEHFAADDPANPIGDYWIALDDAEETTRGRRGYGIHGTIEPQSIGQSMSMGCIRMRGEDVAMLYKLLTSSQSTVRIEP